MTRMPTPSRTNYHNAPLASTRSFTQRIRRLKSDIPLDRGWGRRLVRRRGLVAGQCMHCVVGRLGLFLYGFLFGFEAFFKWFVVLILHWFNHEEPTLLTTMF
ncbi:hypothetical protein BHM03_00062785, partial [Ensete ventricosum]